MSLKDYRTPPRLEVFEQYPRDPGGEIHFVHQVGRGKDVSSGWDYEHEQHGKLGLWILIAGSRLTSSASVIWVLKHHA